MSTVKLAMAASIIGIILLGGSRLLPAQDTNAPVGASPSPSATVVAYPPTACPSGTPLASGTIATIAGNGSVGPTADGARATTSGLTPASMAVDAVGNVYFSEGTSIRRIGSDGVLGTLATGLEAPYGIAVDGSGNVYIADNSVWIKKVDPSGKVTTVAGTGVNGSTGDEGPALSAQINANSVAVGPDGSLYIDDANKFRRIDPAGVIHSFAGTGEHGFSGDGAATKAKIDDAYAGVWADSAGNVYIPDSNNHRIRKVDPSGTITTVVGSGAAGTAGDGGPATKAALSGSQVQVTTDPAGNLYLADYSGSNVRKVDTAGIITKVAGSAVGGFSGDCGPATEARLSAPVALAFHNGALYILDLNNYRIRVVVP